MVTECEHKSLWIALAVSEEKKPGDGKKSADCTFLKSRLEMCVCLSARTLTHSHTHMHISLLAQPRRFRTPGDRYLSFSTERALGPRPGKDTKRLDNVCCKVLKFKVQSVMTQDAAPQ